MRPLVALFIRQVVNSTFFFVFMAVSIDGVYANDNASDSFSDGDSSKFTITMVDTPWPPYVVGDLEEGLLTGGTVVEVVNTIFSKIDHTDVVIEVLPWRRAFHNVEHGFKDGMLLLQKNKQRERVMDFSDEIFTADTVFFYKKSRFPDGIQWQSFKDLSSLRIGSVAGYTVTRHLESISDSGAALNLTKITASDEQLMRMLAKGRIDLFPLNLLVGSEIVKSLGLVDIASTKKTVYTAHFHLAFSKKLDYTRLIKEVNQRLSEMRKDGSLQKILGHRVAPASY